MGDIYYTRPQGIALIYLKPQSMVTKLHFNSCAHVVYMHVHALSYAFQVADNTIVHVIIHKILFFL